MPGPGLGCVGAAGSDPPQPLMNTIRTTTMTNEDNERLGQHVMIEWPLGSVRGEDGRLASLVEREHVVRVRLDVRDLHAR
jgi:hypothetical protein